VYGAIPLGDDALRGGNHPQRDDDCRRTDLETPYYVGVVDLDEACLLGHLEGEGDIGAAVSLADTAVLDGSPATVFEPRS